MISYSGHGQGGRGGGGVGGEGQSVSISCRTEPEINILHCAVHGLSTGVQTLLHKLMVSSRQMDEDGMNCASLVTSGFGGREIQWVRDDGGGGGGGGEDV